MKHLKIKNKVIILSRGVEIGSAEYKDGKVVLSDFGSEYLQAYVRRFMAKRRSFVFNERPKSGTASTSVDFFWRFCLQLWQLGLDFK